MEENKLLTQISIESLIYEIRGQKVMLDRDLAKLYGVETKALNQAVKRNIKRFPEDFMFQLTYDECLRSQIVTLNTKQGHHLKYLPHVFTEQGVAMLSSVLDHAYICFTTPLPIQYSGHFCRTGSHQNKTDVAGKKR